MKRLIATLGLTALIAVGLPPATFAASGFAGGVLSVDTVLTKADGPYQISSTIQIPEGIKLTVQEGVSISNGSNQPLFYVNGSLVIRGTQAEPVLIESKGEVVRLKNATKTSSVEISFARIDGMNRASLFGASGFSQSSNFLIKDSDFLNLEHSYIWYPESFIAERNVFTSSAGFSIGFDGRTAGTPIFRNNLFLGPPDLTYGKEYWIEGWAAYGSALRLEKNSFQGGPYIAVTTTIGSGSIPLNATNNYWGTSDSQLIADMLLDKSDGLDYGNLIDSGSPLASPDGLTPTGLRYSPTPIRESQNGSSSGASTFDVMQRTLATFQGSATGLTSQQRGQVKAAVEANPNAEKFICTGIRYYSQPMSVNIMVRKRAKAACEYAKQLNPSLSTWYQNKPTQARSYAGKVLLTVKTPSDASLNSPEAGGPTPTPTPTQTTTPTPTPTPTPTQTTTPTPTTTETTGQRNARKSAESYLRYSSFSRTGLIDQLLYEEYSRADAEYAVDAVDANWNVQAVGKAESYLSYSAFSRSGLVDQLLYEGFTNSQAEYGVASTNADWNDQAAKTAESYLKYSSFSRQGLIDQLKYEGFSQSQAEYGVSQNGY